MMARSSLSVILVMMCCCCSTSRQANTSDASSFGSIRNTTTVFSESNSSINEAISTSFISASWLFSSRYFFPDSRASSSSFFSSSNIPVSFQNIVILEIGQAAPFLLLHTGRMPETYPQMRQCTQGIRCLQLSFLQMHVYAAFGSG